MDVPPATSGHVVSLHGSTCVFRPFPLSALTSLLVSPLFCFVCPVFYLVPLVPSGLCLEPEPDRQSHLLFVSPQPLVSP